MGWVQGAEDGDVVEGVGTGFGKGGLWGWEGRAEGADGGEEEEEGIDEGGHSWSGLVLFVMWQGVVCGGGVVK